MNNAVMQDKSLSQAADRAADKVSTLIDGAKGMVDEAGQNVQRGLDNLRDSVPGTFARYGETCDNLTRQGVTQARRLSRKAQRQLSGMSDSTVDYIQDQPIKAVLLAAAAGAGLMLLATALGKGSSRQDDRC
jgi:ElaB/YqjD/DUF883 family membrane-anchored ribosome-binding protein